MTLVEDIWSIVFYPNCYQPTCRCIKKKEGRSCRMTNSIIWSIIGMAIVTYIPRSFPRIISWYNLPSLSGRGLKKMSPLQIRCVNFPECSFYSTKHLVWSDRGGAVSGCICTCLFGANVIVVFLGAIGVLNIYSLFFLGFCF